MPGESFVTLPDPAQAAGVDDLVERLRLLKVWAGEPSYETIKDRVNAAWTAAGRPPGELTIRSTVANCFQPGRRRLNTDLVIAIVEALHPDVGYVTQWRQTLRMISGEIEAVSQVRVQDTLPRDLPGFIGRTGELEQLRRAGPAVVISAIEGMPGVGKTQLAVHAGHQLLPEYDRVLFVNLRGFHPDPTQPPADPAAVLDGFLRLLGTPGHRIPHGLTERTTAYHERLADTRTLIVLDNAATAEQVRPLLPGTPGCRALITSRHSLTDLDATRLTVDVFDPAEAIGFLLRAVPGTATGTDPHAAARIAESCGYLPLALGLIAGHIRNTPGWTLTDHADRLDERHRDRRLDAGVELALDLSYQHLPSEQQRLLRLAALHPGQDLDAYAAAALTDTTLETARTWLAHLCADHLLQPAAPGRYALHDLVRAHAAGRAHDEDPPAGRRAALTRLFDHYLATAAAAMDALFPAEAHRRPRIPPAGTPTPEVRDPDQARAWLDTERPTLIVVVAHAATHGWPGHTVGLSRVLSRYLSGGYLADSIAVHSHALDVAQAGDDLAEQAHALRALGFAHLAMGRLEAAAGQLQQALDLFRQTGVRSGEAQALHSLGTLANRSGRYPAAIEYLQQALRVFREAGDRAGEAGTLNNLGVTMEQSRRYPEAIDYLQQSLTMARTIGDVNGEAFTLNALGEAEVGFGRPESARAHLQQALTLYRQLGNRTGEANVLDALGTLHTRLGRFDQATGYYQQALTMLREAGDRHVETWVLNGLGEAAQGAGRAADALAHHAAALAIATDTGGRDPQARAHAGLGQAHQALGDPVRARGHYQQALALYLELGLPEAEQIRAHLAGLDT